MIKKYLTAVAIVACLTTISTPTFAQNPFKAFKNCTELRKVYKLGVARSATIAGSSGATVNAKVYKENIKSDGDKDGIACETK